MGLTQILRDETERAEEHLRTAISFLENVDSELRDFEVKFLEETRHFLDLITTKRVSEAKSLLQARVADLKAKFSIEGKQAIEH